MFALNHAQESRSRKATGVRTYVDAHVHIHQSFEVQEFLNAAARNFSLYSSQSLSERDCRFVLCLTECQGINKFETMSMQLAKPEPREGQWTYQRSPDKECIVAKHENYGNIFIVAGRQIVTAEGLEILALGSIEQWNDGQAISDVIDSVVSSGAIAVLPWGFGKWLGRRGRIVESLIDEYGGGALYLGDNSGRPGIMPDPAAFRMARGKGTRILPGSDPLPFASEFDRAGSFGFYVDDVTDRDGVWAGLNAMLQKGDGVLHHYGSLESPLRFVRNQIAMQYITRVTNRRNAD